VRDVVHRLGGQNGQGGGVDGEKATAAGAVDDVDALVRDQPVVGQVLAEGQQRGMREVRGVAHERQA
jgi:hypothetical protein